MGTGGLRSFSRLVAAACLLAAFHAPPATASHFDSLLAPESACRGQSDPALPAQRASRVGICLHNWARKAAASRSSKKRRSGSARRRAGRGLADSDALGRSAAAKAKDILGCGEFAHEACRRDVFFWHRKKGYAVGCFGVGENLFMASEAAATPRAAMAAWLHSDLHRDALLSSKFREMGIGVRSGLLDGKAVRVWVAHFGYRC